MILELYKLNSLGGWVGNSVVDLADPTGYMTCTQVQAVCEKTFFIYFI